MKRITIMMTAMLLTVGAMAQENLQRQASNTTAKKVFTTVKENPITSVKNQHRSGTCWDYATLGYLESEILRKTGKTYNLCEMFVVNKDYMDNATHCPNACRYEYSKTIINECSKCCAFFL